MLSCLTNASRGASKKIATAGVAFLSNKFGQGGIERAKI